MYNTSSDELVFAADYAYDVNNNINRIGVTSGKSGSTMTFTYGTDNLPQGYSGAGGIGAYGYDKLNRLTNVTNAKFADWTYEYVDIANLQTTTLVKNEISNDNSIGSVSYEYDKNGNITKKILTYQVNGVTCRYENIYTYDELNRLIVEQNHEQNQTIKYKYDAWGNIAMKWVYSGYSTATPSSSNLIKSYDYVYSSSMDDMAWDDLLTEYDGEAIVYDNIGNPTTYRGKTMLWEGRNLTGFYDSDSAAIYAYDSSGIRTMKLHDGEVYYYYYVEGKLMSETCSQYDLFYTYDSRGNLSGIKKVDANGTTTNYGVLSNMFGDVLGIFDLSGNLLAKYTYDSWGNLLSITNASGTDITATDGIWLQNSIRYRGYVYDNESGWYYLQSRYYDPEICRFINADGMITSNNNFVINLFAYANCNPIANIDPTGCFSMSALTQFYETAVGFISDVNNSPARYYDDKTLETIDYIVSLTETGVISYYDDILNAIIQNASLGLNNSLDDISKAFGFVSDKFGLFSLLVDAVNVVWDYNTYKDDMDSFWTSTNISIIFTGIEILAAAGITAVVGIFEWPVAVGVVGVTVLGFVIPIIEDKVKQYYLK